MVLEMLRDARAELGHADQKAGVLFAAFGVGFGALLGALLANDWGPGDLHESALVLWWIAASLAVASVFSAAVAVWPRILHSKPNGPAMFWGHVARFRTTA